MCISDRFCAHLSLEVERKSLTNHITPPPPPPSLPPSLSHCLFLSLSPSLVPSTPPFSPLSPLLIVQRETTDVVYTDFVVGS